MITRIALAFSLLATMSAARADIAWKGTISAGAKSQFALTDTATGASKWVRVGGVFESYSVSNYDEQKQVLTLTHAGASVQLGLASAQYTAPSAPAASTNDLSTMSGMRLAQALADRGDTTLQALLAQHRDAVLNREDTARRLAAGERLLRASAPDAPSPVAMKSYRADLARWDEEVARLNVEIRTTADTRRQLLLGHP